MPHCIVEYSKELEIKVEPTQLNALVFRGAMNAELFDESDIKVRAIAYGEHQTGTDKVDFIHVSLRILNGRTAEQKAMLSSKVLEQLRLLKLRQISLTVEVVDIDKSSYAKHVV